MISQSAPQKAEFTIIQADGLYPVGPLSTCAFSSLRLGGPQDDVVEQQIFKPRGSQQYKLNYHQTSLWPTGIPKQKPWSDVDKALRDQVDGIMVLKMGFTADDLALFPKLKV